MDQLGFSILLQWRAETDAARPDGRRPAPEPGTDSVARVAPGRLTRLQRHILRPRATREG